MRHTHWHTHRVAHPHAIGHTIDVRHTHEHKHRTVVPGHERGDHRPHVHRPSEDADLRAQQLGRKPIPPRERTHEPHDARVCPDDV